VCGVRAGESVLDAEKTVASRTGLSPEAKVALHEQSTETAADQKNRIRTPAPTWQNTYYLEDAGLFRGSLGKRDTHFSLARHQISPSWPTVYFLLYFRPDVLGHTNSVPVRAYGYDFGRDLVKENNS
jgi:hypothetical protein